MSQVKAEKTKSKPERKKLTLSKETLRDLKGRNPETQQVKGGNRALCSYLRSGCE